MGIDLFGRRIAFASEAKQTRAAREATGLLRFARKDGRRQISTASTARACHRSATLRVKSVATPAPSAPRPCRCWRSSGMSGRGLCGAWRGRGRWAAFCMDCLRGLAVIASEAKQPRAAREAPGLLRFACRDLFGDEQANADCFKYCATVAPFFLSRFDFAFAAKNVELNIFFAKREKSHAEEPVWPCWSCLASCLRTGGGRRA